MAEGKRETPPLCGSGKTGVSRWHVSTEAISLRLKLKAKRTSVVQWLSSMLPMAGAWVQSPGQEPDPTCRQLRVPSQQRSHG